MWILRPVSFRVIGLFESQMQATTIILTNESGTSTVKISSAATIKLESTDDNVFVLSYSKDDICAYIELLDTLLYPFRSVDSTPL